MNDRWSVERAFEWSMRQPWLLGFNYVPSYACNTTEWWQADSFDPVTVDRELGWAADIGYNTTRVFLQYIVWRADPPGFMDRFAEFLALAANHGLSVMPVLFDDCAFGEPLQFDPFLGVQREQMPGMILPSWTPSPGRRSAADSGERELLKCYVQDILGRFGTDSRVVLWDLMNEPMNAAEVGTPSFLLDIFAWAREASSQQPLSIGVWNNNREVNEVLADFSDIITIHCYADRTGLAARIVELTELGRPLCCTEWMARGAGSRFDLDLPVFASTRIGCYQWGLVNGRTQCQFPWWNKAGGVVDESTGWFHDILHDDGTPYRPDEIAAIRGVVAAARQAGSI